MSTLAISDNGLSSLELDFLVAAAELVHKQQELLPALSKTVGVPIEEMLYGWTECNFPKVMKWYHSKLKRETGKVSCTDWRYNFHGLECDLSHPDGRFVRVDFGPRGNVDTFTGFGVLQFVMASKPPWREFPELREHLAEKPPPYGHLSGSHARMCVLDDRLIEAGMFEPAAPDLVALMEAHSYVDADGQRMFDIPEKTHRSTVDCLVANRHVLSDKARDVVGSCEGMRE